MMTKRAVDPTRRVRLALLLVMGIAVGAGLIAVAMERPPLPARSYGEFLADVTAGRVDHVVQQDQDLTVSEGSTTFRVVVPSVLTNVYLDMQNAAAQAGRRLPDNVYEAQPAQDNSWVGLVLTGLLPLIVIGGFIYLMMRRAQSAARPFGLASRLEQLEEARRLGRITAQEYADKRAEILKNL